MPHTTHLVILACLLSPLASQSIATAPLARPAFVGSPAAFDTVRGRLVMFSDDRTTWEPIGGNLLPRADIDGAPRPPGRYDHAMCFDEARRRVLMFGGVGGNSQLDDTWAYDGSRWTQLTGGPTPPARSLAAMAWDAHRNRIVMWGGSGLSDTWEHDGSSWVLQSPTTSPTPNGGTMVFDSQRGVAVLVVPTFTTNETWEWDGTDWFMRASFGPQISEPTMAFDPLRSRTVLVGGAGNDRVWEWNGTSWAASPVLPQPFQRLRSASWFDPSWGAVLVTGGIDFGQSQPNDLWQWNGTTLIQLTGDRGPRASSGTLISDPPRGQLLHFGGTLPSQLASDETWALAGGAWSAIPSPTRPSPRSSAAGTHDPIRGESLLFGGITGSGVLLGDTWSIAGSGWVSRATSGPSPRMRAAMAADPLRGVVVLFGGEGASPTSPMLNDTWEWNGTLWTQRATAVQPAARAAAAMAFHPQLGKMLLFGGDGAGLGNVLNDTWTWDGIQWVRLLPATVPPRLQPAAMSSDPNGNRCILAGPDFPTVGGTRQQAWTHDGTDWRLVMDEAAPEYGLWTPCAPGVGASPFVCIRRGAPAAAVELTFTPGRVATIGAGCGTPASTLMVRSRPRIGTTTGLELLANPARAVLFGLDLASGNTPLGGGCTVWLSPAFLGLFQISNASGFAEQPLLVPANPGLRGLDLFAQAAVLEPQSSNGLVLTQGLRLTLGD